MQLRNRVGFWLALGFILNLTPCYACNDFYVCAPDDPVRHTVDSANFTNLYLYPNPKDMTWDQATAQALKQANGLPAMTVQAIDGFVKSLTQDSSYFSRRLSTIGSTFRSSWAIRIRCKAASIPWSISRGPLTTS